MNKLIELSRKNTKNIVGLMTGTSLNGIDAALIEVEGNGAATEIKMIGFLEHPFPAGLKDLILRNSVPETSRVDQISQLNFLMPQLYADAISALCSQIDFPIDKIDLIGSHGQTIQHLPNKEIILGKEVSSTLQIGDPSVLAKLTNKITVGNFRTGDVALGGQGAPLIPYFDYLIFHSNKNNLALLNIGGISNFTILPKEGSLNDLLAFDTGPGNMPLDYASEKFFGVPFDAYGKKALSGKFNDKIFKALLKHDNYIEIPPPKSTGREIYGEEFIESIYGEFSNISGEDWLNTLANFTAYAVFRNYQKFVEDKVKIDELIVSGGGANNEAIVNYLKQYFQSPIKVKLIDELGVSGDAKEAICFAVLANETISGNPANVPRATGASKETILGQICLP